MTESLKSPPNLTDAFTLLIGLALGMSFGILIHSLGVGIGTGVAMGVASNMSRRRNSQHWLLWLTLYSVVVLIAASLRVAGILK